MLGKKSKQSPGKSVGVRFPRALFRMVEIPCSAGSAPQKLFACAGQRAAPASVCFTRETCRGKDACPLPAFREDDARQKGFDAVLCAALCCLPVTEAFAGQTGLIPAPTALPEVLTELCDLQSEVQKTAAQGLRACWVECCTGGPIGYRPPRPTGLGRFCDQFQRYSRSSCNPLFPAESERAACPSFWRWKAVAGRRAPIRRDRSYQGR